jgi:hypothetical protein
MVQLTPCPPSMLEELKRKFKKNPIQHVVLWDTTYALNEEGSCQVMDQHKFRNLRQCDGYEPDRYRIVASMGDPV